MFVVCILPYIAHLNETQKGCLYAAVSIGAFSLICSLITMCKLRHLTKYLLLANCLYLSLLNQSWLENSEIESETWRGELMGVSFNPDDVPDRLYYDLFVSLTSIYICFGVLMNCVIMCYAFN